MAFRQAQEDLRDRTYAVGYEIVPVSQPARMRNPTPTLTLPLKGEGIL